MKNGKAKHTDIITFIVSVVIIFSLVASGGTGKLSLAMASVVFFSGMKSETESKTVIFDKEETETTTQKEEKSVSQSSDITETPSDIKELIRKYTELFKNDKKVKRLSARLYLCATMRYFSCYAL